ncbi:MAG TPA: hypothetical protein DCZ11_02065 [Gammaproteobacteria bacterium]|nr:hypothetical protein [Gammaproteobacteria bacterium]MCH77210.1 hypothetical protein [Gammaproteobacteria bacterium]
MDKNLLIGGVIGAVVVTAGGAIAGFGLLDKEAEYAEVLKVTELTETVTVPRQVCEQVAVTRQEPVKDDKQIIGTVAGAVVGGLVGNQIGGGSGKKIATVAGAVGGGLAGHEIEKRRNTSTYWEVTVQMDNGTTRTVQYPQAPGVTVGQKVKVIDGQLVLM